MSLQLRVQNFIEKSNIKFPDKYIFTKMIYLKSNEKVILICKKHNEEVLITPSNHLNSPNGGCLKCNKENFPLRKTLQQFIDDANKVHKGIYGYTKVIYENDNTEVLIDCGRCGETFLQKPRVHLAGHGHCGRVKNLEHFLFKAEAYHGKGRYDYTEVKYEKSNEPVKIKCNVCKLVFWQSPSEHYRYGCNLCAKKSCLLSQKQFIDKCVNIHKDKYDYSNVEYKGYYTDVLIYCKNCEKIFPQSPHIHLAGKGCPTCSSSRSEKMCRNIFEELFSREFSKCYPKWIKDDCNIQLELDGYNEELKLAFEYQGEQHCKFIKFFHKTENAFQKRKLYDNFKRIACAKNNVTLIEIPYIYSYLDENNMKAFIYKELAKYGFIVCKEIDSKILKFENEILDLTPYVKDNNIKISKQDFSGLKNMDRDIVVNSIMNLLNTYQSPLLPYSSSEEILKDYKLVENSLTQITETTQESKEFSQDIMANMLGRKLLNHIMLPVMIEAYKNNSISYTEAWNRLDIRRKLVERMVQKDERMNNGSIYNCYGCKYGRLYNFPPNVAKALYNKFNAKKVLDPCAGYGGRMLGFWASDAEEYTGIDPNTKIPYNELQSILSNVSNKKKTVKIYTECAENMNEYLGRNSYDFIFTSPPYFDVEIYSEEKTQSYHYGNHEDWLKKFLFPMIENSIELLEPNGYFLINIKEYDKPFIDRMKNIIILHNMKELEHIRLVQSKRYKSNNYEIIYVFQK
jgi:tRNA1(Val) A37 N6-methylase TrmN6